MSARKIREWFIDTVFGKVAMISWGDPGLPPILMVHGYMDTAATFSFLPEQLPDSYYYVAFDIPGHGKSCPMPGGPPPSHATAMEALRAVVDHMGWDSFVLLGHSMGGIIGMFYNYLFPGKITKMVLLDPVDALCKFYYFFNHDMQTFYGFFYDEYYRNLTNNTESPKLYSYEKVVTMTMKNREISRDKAEVVISRSLEPVGELYRFSTQPSVKKMGIFPVQTDILFAILANQPPTLSLMATTEGIQPTMRDFANQLVRILEKENNVLYFVEGHHDSHISNPEALAPFIVKFLCQDKFVTDKKAKL